MTINTRDRLRRLPVGTPLKPVGRTQGNDHAAKRLPQPPRRRAFSRGGECTIPNCDEARNSHKISGKDQPGHTHHSARNGICERRSHQIPAQNDFLVLHSGRLRIGFTSNLNDCAFAKIEFASGIRSSRANIDYRFARWRDSRRRFPRMPVDDLERRRHASVVASKLFVMCHQVRVNIARSQPFA